MPIVSAVEALSGMYWRSHWADACSWRHSEWLEMVVVFGDKGG